MSGAFVAVVGPSGVGKDSVLAAVRTAVAVEDPYRELAPRLSFPQRYITRSEKTGEDHIPVTPAEFATLKRTGGLSLAWQAHNLDYGIPASALADIEAGKTVIANVSRTVLPSLRELFGRAYTVRITVSPEVRRARILARGREAGTAAEARLARPDPAPHHPVDLDIVNDTTLDEAAATFLHFLVHIHPSLTHHPSSAFAHPLKGTHL